MSRTTTTTAPMASAGRSRRNPRSHSYGAGGAQRRDDREEGGDDHRDRGSADGHRQAVQQAQPAALAAGHAERAQLGQVRLVELDLAADGLAGEQRDDGQQDQPEQPDGHDLGSEEGPYVPEPIPAGRDHRLEVVGGRHLGDLAAEALQPAGSVAQGDVLHEVAQRVRMAVEERRGEEGPGDRLATGEHVVDGLDQPDDPSRTGVPLAGSGSRSSVISAGANRRTSSTTWPTRQPAVSASTRLMVISSGRSAAAWRPCTTRTWFSRSPSSTMGTNPSAWPDSRPVSMPPVRGDPRHEEGRPPWWPR